ncbi:MAG: hypothetical protein HXX09_13730 [Bacteroidetes bacterium]|nr:hypothetical protein [Bacteroidota bacterium]
MKSTYFIKEKKPIRFCEYRYCPRLLPIPSSRRADAKYCCDEHAYKELNEKNKVSSVTMHTKHYKSNFKIVGYLYSNGMRIGHRDGLKALMFHFNHGKPVLGRNLKTGKIFEMYGDLRIDFIGTHYCITRKSDPVDELSIDPLKVNKTIIRVNQSGENNYLNGQQGKAKDSEKEDNKPFEYSIGGL